MGADILALIDQARPSAGADPRSVGERGLRDRDVIASLGSVGINILGLLEGVIGVGSEATAGTETTDEQTPEQAEVINIEVAEQSSQDQRQLDRDQLLLAGFDGLDIDLSEVEDAIVAAGIAAADARARSGQVDTTTSEIEDNTASVPSSVETTLLSNIDAGLQLVEGRLVLDSSSGLDLDLRALLDGTNMPTLTEIPTETIPEALVQLGGIDSLEGVDIVQNLSEGTSIVVGDFLPGLIFDREPTPLEEQLFGSLNEQVIAQNDEIVGPVSAGTAEDTLFGQLTQAMATFRVSNGAMESNLIGEADDSRLQANYFAGPMA